MNWFLLSPSRCPRPESRQPVRSLIDELDCQKPPAASEEQEGILTNECLPAATNRWRPFGIAIIGKLKAFVPGLIGLIYDTGTSPGCRNGETRVVIGPLYRSNTRRITFICGLYILNDPSPLLSFSGTPSFSSLKRLRPSKRLLYIWHVGKLQQIQAEKS